MPSLLEALNFERERDFLMGFPLQSINQLQRNTSETRNGLLAGGVMTKALAPSPSFCVFCSCYSLGQDFGAA